MACISDMDISRIYPQLHAEPSTPMHSLAAWDPERLLRLSRWKPIRGNPKDVVRSYAKAILALSDLHEAATCLQLSPPVVAKSSQNSTRPIRNSKVLGNTANEPASSHALACRDKVLPQAVLSVVPQPGVSAAGPWFLRPPCEVLLAPPTRVLNAMRSWWLMLAYAAQASLVLLQWLPVVLFLVALAVLLTDPTLIFTIAWEFLSLIPAAIRQRLSGQAPYGVPSSETTPLGAHHSRLVTTANAIAPPAFAHPSMHSPAQVGAPGVVLSVLAVEGGGAGLFYWLVSRGFLSVGAQAA